MPSVASDTPLPALLRTVFTSILEVFLLCLAGYILASRGILDKTTQKQLNRINVSLFTPALLFSKVAFFLTPAKLKELWIIPLIFAAVTTVSMTVAFVFGWLLGLKKSQRSFAMAAAMFMNSNSLPIALMQSLVVTIPALRRGDDDNEDAMLGRALTYLVLYSTLGMVLRWSYGVRLLSQADTEDEVAVPNETTPLLAATRSPMIADTITDVPESIIPTAMQGESQPRAVPKRKTTYYNSFPNSPNDSQGNLLSSGASSRSDLSTMVASSPADSDSEEHPGSHQHSDAPVLPTHRRKTRDSSHHSHKHGVWHRFRVACVAVSQFMTAPLWAASCSLVVACIQPLQHALNEHSPALKSALSAAGGCSIPVTLVVLGAYFYVPPAEGEKALSFREKVRSLRAKVFSKRTNRTITAANVAEIQRSTGTEGESRTVLVAVLSRMVLTPMILLPLVAAATTWDMHVVFDDPIFVVANVLLMGSPPALTLAQITQAACGDAFERLISRTVFWSYCIVTTPTTIVYVLVGLLLAKL